MNKILVLIMGTFLGLGLLVCGGLVGFIYYVNQEVEGISVTISVPDRVTVGETLDLVVTVSNNRRDEVLELESVDLTNTYLSGFTLISNEPTESESMHIPLLDEQSFTYNMTIEPGASQAFRYTLRAESPGTFRGEVTMYEGILSIIKTMQTTVYDDDVEAEASAESGDELQAEQSSE